MSHRSLSTALLAALAAAAFVLAGALERGPTSVGVVASETADEASTAARVHELAEPARRSTGRDADEPRLDRGKATQRRDASARDVRLTIVATEHGTGRPVAGARAWIVDDDYQELVCDAAGRATFHAVPDFTLMGVHPPDGSSFIAFQNDPTTGLPSAQDERTTTAGQTVEIPLVLHRGATVRGVVLGPDGAPYPGAPFTYVPDERDRYRKPTRITSDDDGRFELRGLAPGTHTFGTGSSRLAYAVPNVTLDLDWAETREIELRLLPSKAVDLTVRVVQESSGEPWPFAFRVGVTRNGPLPDAGRPSRQATVMTSMGTTPTVHSVVLSPGAHELRAAAVITLERSQLYVNRGWSRKVDVTIDDELSPQEIVLTAPDVPRLAHLEVTVNGDSADASRYLRVRYSGDDWTASHPVEPREEDGRFDVWADLDILPTGEVKIVETGNGFEATLATVTLLEGEQSVTVTPSPR